MDAAFEKHVPVIEQNGDAVTVKVGSVEHPSMPEHYIEWIVLVTESGIQMKLLKLRTLTRVPCTVTVRKLLKSCRFCFSG